MYDGAELAKAIVAHPGDVDAAIAEYEDAMFVRSAKQGVEAMQTHELCFDDRAPSGLLALLRGEA